MPNYFVRMRAKVKAGGKLSHLNGLRLLAAGERLNELVPKARKLNPIDEMFANLGQLIGPQRDPDNVVRLHPCAKLVTPPADTEEVEWDR